MESQLINYKNLDARSSVVAYRIDNESKSIDVKFRDGSIYSYRVGMDSNNITEIEWQNLCNAANQGRGLNSMISKQIRNRFVSSQNRPVKA
jgi:hypothetical protein